ncbi:IS1 family transposase [Thalassotalea sp. HSM 43]|uniref:IS1 family transposase n=1 Tax=Thalassotalea sp. HSM 43 TaxID=2552945 RepID=UPI0010800208|nr:IS1 family transposase [Thalassotalea sp. HSM 43]QBY05917.1 IS1 family transposase [Thalassotalea sp. HSM 43]
MGQISGQQINPRVPWDVEGVNVNCCTDPECENFNVPAIPTGKDQNYIVTGIGKFTSAIRCKACGKHVSVKSNQALVDEMLRFRHLDINQKIIRQDGKGCSQVDCVNYGLPINKKKTYRKRGKTSKGHQRYECLGCNKTFTVGSEKRKNHPENKTFKNEFLFKLLVNQTALNRAMELTSLSGKAIYKKIDMFYERSISFLNEREERLKKLPLNKLQLSTDRQEYNVNWTRRKDKRNVVLSGVGTADKVSRYVFGMNVNYDDTVDLEAVSTSPEYNQDSRLKMHNRHFARIWTLRDYFDDKKNANTKELELDEDDRFVVSKNRQLPDTGTQVRSEFTMLAHFKLLEELIGHCEDITFHLDQDSGINRACCLAFANQISDGKCHAMYVKIDKSLTVDERRNLVNETETLIDEIIETGVANNRNDALRAIALNGLNDSIHQDKYPFVWHPVDIHKINEANKWVSFITDTNFMDVEEQINLLLRSTLQPIDNFFQIVRRRLSLLERPIQSSSNAGRVWGGKQPYNPSMVNKMLQILRVYFNFCLTGKDGKTPAQRLGLAKGPVEIRKILYPSTKPTN